MTKQKKITRYQDIPQFTRSPNYKVNVSWDYLQDWLDDHNKDGQTLVLDPDYQRDHVWTEQQQIAYIEYILRGGKTGREIHFNCPGWMSLSNGDQTIELVDGKQRLRAVLRFLKDEIPAFGSLKSEYKDRFPWASVDFVIHVNDLRTRKEVLQWYVDMNAGGTVHTQEEIDKVRKMIKKEDRS